MVASEHRHAEFAPSLRFELFYALQILSDPKSRIHRAWVERTLNQLPSEFHRKSRRTSPNFWANFSDLLGVAPIDLSFDQIASEMRAISSSEFQQRILYGLIHDDELAHSIVRGEMSLERSLAKTPKIKREWLTFVGLYPYGADNPEIQTLESLLADPVHVQRELSELLSIFWEESFQDTWTWLQPQYQRSAGEKERLFQCCSFSEFARHALLRIEVDETKDVIRALRGGAEQPISAISQYYFIPSAFNDNRLWTSFDREGQTSVYFPYFDPTLTLDLELAQSRPAAVIEPELDPALIFRALGDTTRYALASVIARSPKTSVELTKILSVAKPTISHHVSLLRAAGLIDEDHVDGSVKISLRRGVIEKLSSITVERLFNSTKTLTLSKTRNKT